MNRSIAALLLVFASLLPAQSASRTDERKELLNVLSDQLRRCYMLPLQAKGESPVTLKVRLKEDGSLEQPPEVVRGEADSFGAKAAMRAFSKCTPFKIPPEWASRYRKWKVLRIQFNTN